MGAFFNILVTGRKVILVVKLPGAMRCWSVIIIYTNRNKTAKSKELCANQIFIPYMLNEQEDINTK
jgi:hypothetical protein